MITNFSFLKTGKIQRDTMSVVTMIVSPHGKRHQEYERSMLLHRGSHVKKKRRMAWNQNRVVSVKPIKRLFC